MKLGAGGCLGNDLGVMGGCFCWIIGKTERFGGIFGN